MEHAEGTAASRAERALALVIAAVHRGGGQRFHDERLVPELIDSWVEGDDVFCLVYRQPLTGSTVLGLRRTVEPDWSVEGVADEVITCELGEPLGSVGKTLQTDEVGVMWWTGNRAEWKARR